MLATGNLGMKVNRNILALRIIHIIGAIILYFSMAVLIYFGIFKESNSLTNLSILFLLLEIFLILIFGECPLTRMHRFFDDKRGFFGLFLPDGYKKMAFIISILLGLFSFIFYVFRII